MHPVLFDFWRILPGSRIFFLSGKSDIILNILISLLTFIENDDEIGDEQIVSKEI